MRYKISPIINNSNTARDCRLVKMYETGSTGGGGGGGGGCGCGGGG
jgi:hypothetical protein